MFAAGQAPMQNVLICLVFKYSFSFEIIPANLYKTFSHGNNFHKPYNFWYSF